MNGETMEATALAPQNTIHFAEGDVVIEIVASSKSGDDTLFLACHDGVEIHATTDEAAMESWLRRLIELADATGDREAVIDTMDFFASEYVATVTLGGGSWRLGDAKNTVRAMRIAREARLSASTTTKGA